MNALATAVPTPPAASGSAAAAAKGALVAADLARDFPILSRPVRGRRLVYLDNGATTQKPEAVIEAERRFYRESNANIHRGVHWLSQHATDLYEQARERVQRLLNAASADEIVFTRGTTEAINLVAYSWGRANLKAGDEVVLTGMEHHSNIVPWQLVCEQTGAVLRVVPITDRGELRLDAYEALPRPPTRLVAVEWFYAWTRNPMVLAGTAGLLGLGLYLRSGLFLLFVALIFVPIVIAFLTLFEERELEIRFGQEYLDYKARTPGFIPRRP